MRHKEDRGRRKRNHLGICIMPNEVLERLMGCLLASIAKRKEKKRELLFLSLHPLNKLKHTDTEQVRKNTVHGGRQDTLVSLWNSHFCQASVGGKHGAEGTLGVGAEHSKPQT